MPTDQFGNYQTGLVSLANTVPFAGGALFNGSGAPDDVDGENGDLYLDRDSGQLYQKSNDAWGVITGGSGGIGEVHYIGTPGQDPNTHVTATRGAIAYDSAGAVWVKTTSGNNNTGWLAIIQ